METQKKDTQGALTSVRHAHTSQYMLHRPQQSVQTIMNMSGLDRAQTASPSASGTVGDRD